MLPVSKGKRSTLLAACGLVAVAACMVVVNWPRLKAWYRFLREFDSLGSNDQGYPEYRHLRTGIVFVSLPGGTFMMGSPEGEEGRDDNELQHEVTLRPFLIAKFEVSEEEWRRAMGDLRFRSSPRRHSAVVADGEHLPVNEASWEDWQEFCKATGFQPPTEAQWEYACRAGTQTRYSSGDTEADLGSVAWYDGNSGGRLHAVGKKSANAFGLHDMHGNVWEWCEDVYDDEFYRKPEAKKNPVSTAGSVYRVIRGGSCRYPAPSCRSANRSYIGPPTRFFYLGLRPVMR